VLEQGGARIVLVSIPEIQHTLALEFAIVMAEAASYHSAAIRDQSGSIGEGIRTLFQSGAVLPAHDYLLAQRLRSLYCAAFDRAYELHGLDAVIAPTIPLAAYAPTDEQIEIDGREEPIIEAAVRTTAPFNLTGRPVVSLPSGLTDDGLPVSVQFAGRPHGERALLALAKEYESRRDSRALDETHPIRRLRLDSPRRTKERT
jgi:aspartyl-tRNA(Asn)/glutamyl-tRNA(Gln) amidotransferase subunit A